MWQWTLRASKHVSRPMRVISGTMRNAEGAELLEFALALPMILVMVLGLMDFAHAYNLKQKLANAAREGARLGSASTADITNPSPPTVPAIRDDVVTYLQNAGVDTSFIGTNMSYNTTTYTATYYSTGNYGLEIERNVLVTGGGTTMQATRVTLRYPYNWTFGFNEIIKLLVPSASYAGTIQIETDALMQNQGG
jgi:Flp pilus assembly protein TadG